MTTLCVVTHYSMKIRNVYKQQIIGLNVGTRESGVVAQNDLHALVEILHFRYRRFRDLLLIAKFMKPNFLILLWNAC